MSLNWQGLYLLRRICVLCILILVIKVKKNFRLGMKPSGVRWLRIIILGMFDLLFNLLLRCFPFAVRSTAPNRLVQKQVLLMLLVFCWCLRSLAWLGLAWGELGWWVGSGARDQARFGMVSACFARAWGLGPWVPWHMEPLGSVAHI